MIKTFRDSDTQRVFQQEYVKGLPEDIQGRAHRKLVLIDSAEDLNDLGRMPGNRLKQLKGARKGEWSIRINEQWRVCFLWENGDAYQVCIEDYH